MNLFTGKRRTLNALRTNFNAMMTPSTNRTVRASLALMLALAIAIFPGLSFAQAESSVPTGPEPGLDPQEVVSAMLAALKKNSDEGIEELYSFSSPGNLERVGPLEHFSRIIREGFPDMLGLKDARMAPAYVDRDRAMVTVQIIGSDEALHEYVFILSLQEIETCNGCWMADAVVNGQHFSQPPQGHGLPPGHPSPHRDQEEEPPEPGQPYETPA